MADKIAIRLTKKPLAGVPVGGDLLLSRMQARVVVLLGLGDYAPEKPAPRPRVPAKPRAARSKPKPK